MFMLQKVLPKKKNNDENLNKRFVNTSNFSNHDLNKFILFLQKAFQRYEYMNDLGKLHETTLPEKETFCNHLNMQIITEVYYTNIKRVL